MSLRQWGLAFERQHNDEPHLWDVVPGVVMSDHGAHIMAYPFFDSHPTYHGQINWKTAEGGYVRGI